MSVDVVGVVTVAVVSTGVVSVVDVVVVAIECEITPLTVADLVVDDLDRGIIDGAAPKSVIEIDGVAAAGQAIVFNRDVR